MSDRRVLAVSAACITAAIFLFLLGTYPSWKAAVGGGLSWQSETLPAADPSQMLPDTKTSEHQSQPSTAPTAVAVTPGPAAVSPTIAVVSVPQNVAGPVPPPAPASATEGAPSFDIVRVEPSGDSVIAARSKPGAVVILLDQGHPIAQAQADGSGQVAFVPPVLSPGEHSLMLSVGQPDAPGSLSSQSVAVSIPAQARTAPMVALLQPDQPTRLLSNPMPAGAPGAAATLPPVSIGAIDVEEMGSVFATGHAAPNSQCRVYLNGSFVANVMAGKDGTWSLKIQHGMKPGHYSVRVDQLTSTSGQVQARSEVPFDYPARAATSLSLLRPRKGMAALPIAPLSGATPAQAANMAVVALAVPLKDTQDQAAGRIATDQVPAAMASAVDPAALATSTPAGIPTVVAQLLTTKVSHGDSLWRISRKMLGHGRRYTQIYAANTSQIRDPRLIYPGQIFVMPQNAP